MIRYYDLNKDQFIDTNFKDEIQGFTSLRAITYVSSFQLINELMPLFEKIEIIHGFTGTSFQLINQLLDITNRIENIRLLKSETFNALLDERLEIYLAHAVPIHHKTYILEKDRDYKILSGSANLTTSALQGRNHELLFIRTGSTNDTFYTQMHEMWNEIKRDTIDYIDPSSLDSILERPEEVIESFLTDIDVPATLIQEAKPEIEKLHTHKVDTIFEEKEAPAFLPLVLTKTGRRRKPKPEEIRKQVRLAVDERLSSYDMNKQLTWQFDFEEHAFIIGEDYLHDLLREKVVPSANGIIDVIESYEQNKFRDERHQVFTGILYLLTSPLIWKIREIYTENHLPKEDVPVVMNIVGDGQTGKTTLVREYFSTLLDYASTPTYSMLKIPPKGKKPSARIANDYIDGYLHSDWVNPLIIDEVPNNFFTTTHGENNVKSWSNDRKGIFPILITTSNISGALAKPQLLRRILMIPIDSKYRESKDQPFDVYQLVSNLDPLLPLFFLNELSKRLDSTTPKDIERLKEDYLSLSKEVLFTLAPELETYANENGFLPNYDIVNHRGKTLWAMTLMSKADHICVNPKNEKEIIVYESAFKTHHDRTEAKTFLPGGVLVQSGGNSLTLNSELLEQFVGFSIQTVWENQSASRTGKQIADAMAKQLAPLLENKKKPSRWKTLWRN